MLEATIYLNDKPEGDVSGDITKGFQDRLEQRAIQTSPAMQYFNNYKKQQVVEEVDEQEELIPSLIGKTVREPEVDAFTQIYALNALDAQEPVQEVVQPKVDKPLLQEAWDILPTGGQQTVWPFIAPFVKGSAEENPILRGMTQGALHDAPQGMVDLSRDVVNAIGGEFKEEDWLKIPQILESNPDSTTEGVVRGLSQFMSIFGAAGGIGKGATLFKQMMAGGLADATFDPTGGNVATLLRELDMDNALTQFLDSKVGEDADALERLQARGKQVLEGAGIGFAIPTLIGGIKWAKNAGSPWIKEFMQDSDPALVQNTLKKLGIDMPQKDIVQGGPKKQTKETAADYRMTHTAARSEGKNSLDDFSESMPDNPNDPNFARYYGMGGEYSKADAETIAVMKAVRGKPDAEVTIYRAVPKGIKDINAGDWVSTSKSYANSHGERHIEGGYDLIEKKVRAGDLNTDGDLHEWGYNPSKADDGVLGQVGKKDSKTLYHATDELFDEFHIEKSADGTIWFTDNKDVIDSGQLSGVGSRKYTMERIINENDLKLGGWDDTDRYSTGELLDLGYDGLKLEGKGETHYQIFNPDKLKKIDDGVLGQVDKTKNPTTDLRNSLREGGYKIDMHDGVSGEIVLSRIEVPQNVRGKGLGSKAMDQIVEMADKEGKIIRLTPDISFGGTSVARLKKFYKRFGFVENKGKNKDFTFKDTMLRLPKTIEKEPLDAPGK